MELKAELEKLHNGSFEHSNGQNIQILLDEMVNQVGSVDPYLRDELIYPAFVKLITTEMLTAQQCKHLLRVCTDHLLYQIGEGQSDSVFTRSFSVLVIAVLVSYDSKAAILSEEEFKQVLLKGNTYLRDEKDTIGFVTEKGWAHSIAHGADLLVACVSHPMFESENVNEILMTLNACLFKEATFIDDEDERLALVVEALTDKYMNDAAIKSWVSKVVSSLDAEFKREGFSNNYFRTKFNVLNFLKTLYFRLDAQGDKTLSKGYIAENLHRFHKQVYG